MPTGKVSRPPRIPRPENSTRGTILASVLLSISAFAAPGETPLSVAPQQNPSQTSVLAGAPGPSAAEVAAGYKRLDAFTLGLQSLEADFQQTLRDGRGRTVEESEGTLSLLRPGRFRWDYRKPHVVQVVSDGTRLWQYDQDLQQVTVRTVDATLADTPAMLLSGRGNLRDTFVVQRTEISSGLSWIVLRPKRADTDFREVRLGFEGDTLKAMELADKLGQTTTLDFSQVRRNPRLDDGRFGFQVPPGVDVIGEHAPEASTAPAAPAAPEGQ